METGTPVLPAPGVVNGSRPVVGRTVTRGRALPGGRAVVGGLLVAASAVGVFAAYGAADRGPSAAYVVLTRDVAPGEVLRPGDLELVAMDLPSAQRGNSFTDPGILVGTVALGGMKDGQLVQSADVAEVDGAGDLAQISVAVDGGAAMNGDRRYLRPGERVAVIVTYDRGGEVVTETVAADALVVDVLAPERDLGAAGALTVVLGVPPSELEAVAGAAATGTVTLARTTGLAMSAERYVVLGLATPRAEWFRDLTRWSASAAVPVELVRCVSVEDLRARVAGGRAWSAVLLDGSVSGIDLDLVAGAGTPVLVVDDGRRTRDWHAIGAAAVLPPTLERQALLDALAAHARPVGAVAADEPPIDLRERRAPLAVVLGPGGTGATTCAAALAQGLARRHDVLLADLALHAEQGVLHDVGDVAPGVQELVEAHRARELDDVRSLTFTVADRGYALLLGLRQARHWSTLRPRAVEVGLAALRRSFGVVVADVTADLDATTPDLEERNALARTAVAAADVVFAVGRPTTKGVHSLVRVLTTLDRTRAVPVLVGAPKQPRQRAELTAVLSQLAHTSSAPLFLPARPVDLAWRDATPMPAPLADLLAGAFEATYDRLGPVGRREEEPVLVRPGSLGVA